MPSANRLARGVLLALFTVIASLAGAAEALAAEPAPPAGLRAEVYSRTAAELFWERPATFGLRYEVRRDGVVLTTTDGVSFFDDTLAAGTAYAYAVIAIDREGGRSAPARVTLETRGGAPAGRPPAPTGLRAEVYSRTAAELFWDRPDTFGLRYEVRRDGEVAVTTDGVSFFDDTLAAGTAYAYTVIAIDADGQRSPAARVTLETDGGTSTGAGPSMPTRLRAEVYSRTAAELFWDRPDAVGLRYEVRRDGSVIATTDGVSYFDDALAASRDYTYQVIAIDASGRRSSPTSVTARTDNGATVPPTPDGPTPPIQPDRPDDELDAIRPRELSIKIYSSTAAELLWTPNGSFRPVIQRNEIRRNGTLIATVEGEFLASYFDADRQPGQSYTYEVTAISSAGRASATVSDADAEPAPSTPPPGTIQPASDLPASVSATLVTVFDIIDGRAIEQVMATIARLADREFRGSAGFVSVGVRETPFDETYEVFTCPNGGELLELWGRLEPESEPKPLPGRFSVQFDATDCAVGPIVFTGFMQREGTSGFAPGGVVRSGSVNAIDVELDDSRDLSTVRFEQAFYFPDETEPRFSSYSAFDIEVETPGFSWTATNVRGDGRDRRNRLPDGTFGLTTRADDILGPFPSTATMRTLGPFEFDNGRDDARPSGGRLEIGTGSDKLLIDAFNADPSTFTLTVTASGSTTSYTVPFSDAYRFETPTTVGVDIGF